MTQPSDPSVPQPTPGNPPGGGIPSASPLPAAAQGYGVGHPAAPVVPAGMYADQVSGLILPQGVELASVGRRIGAFFLAIPLFIVTLGIGYAIWGLVVWANGQTPALQVLGMRCWRPSQGRVAHWGWMALRETIGRFIEGLLLVTELLSFILMCTTRERRCIHDMVAGTVVLRDPNKVLAARAA